MSIGERIKTIRKDNKLTQQELSSKIGISKQAVYNYENEKSTPNLTILNKIADALKTNINVLTNEKEYMNYLLSKVKVETHTFKLTETEQKELQNITASYFRQFLSCIDSSYSESLNSKTLANIAYSKDFYEFMEFMILKDKLNLLNNKHTKEEIELSNYFLDVIKSLLTLMSHFDLKESEEITSKELMLMVNDLELKEFLKYLFLKHKFNIME